MTAPQNSRSAQVARLLAAAPVVALPKYEVRICHQFFSSYLNALAEKTPNAEMYRINHLHYSSARLLEVVANASSYVSMLRRMEHEEGFCARSIPNPIPANQQWTSLHGTGFTRAEVVNLVESFVTGIANQGIGHLKDLESDNYSIYITRIGSSTPVQKIEREFVVFRSVDWKGLVAEHCSQTNKDFLLAQLMSI